VSQAVKQRCAPPSGRELLKIPEGVEITMAEEESTSKTTKSTEKPLIFISHDSRDAKLAKAFSKLLKSVSAGMLKSFRSSDKKGTEGIQFGDD
jgi:hypothetical protein